MRRPSTHSDDEGGIRADDDVEDERDDAHDERRDRPHGDHQGEVTVGRDHPRFSRRRKTPRCRRDRREGDDRAQGGQHDQDEVERALPVREVGEARLEGEGEQKSAQDLRTGLQHPHFLEDVDPVAIGPLRRALIAPVEGRVASGIPTGRSHVLILARHRCRRARDPDPWRQPLKTRDRVSSCAAGWSSSVARWAHNPEVAGSNPVPATERRRRPARGAFFFCRPTGPFPSTAMVRLGDVYSSGSRARLSSPRSGRRPSDPLRRIAPRRPAWLEGER